MVIGSGPGGYVGAIKAVYSHLSATFSLSAAKLSFNMYYQAMTHITEVGSYRVQGLRQNVNTKVSSSLLLYAYNFRRARLLTVPVASLG